MIDALAYALAEDPKVAVIGAPSFLYDRGLSPEAERTLFEKFPERLIDPPTSESVVTSLATGAPYHDPAPSAWPDPAPLEPVPAA